MPAHQADTLKGDSKPCRRNNSKRRTKVKELPKQEKELTKDEAKKVKGGVGALFVVDLAAKPKQ